MSEAHVEKLVGRRVRDLEGRSVGRIGEIIVSKKGTRYVVEEFHIGTMAFAERLAVSVSSLLFRSRGGKGLIARWDQLDLRDQDGPVLTCPVAELERLKPDRD